MICAICRRARFRSHRRRIAHCTPPTQQRGRERRRPRPRPTRERARGADERERARGRARRRPRRRPTREERARPTTTRSAERPTTGGSSSAAQRSSPLSRATTPEAVEGGDGDGFGHVTRTRRGFPRFVSREGRFLFLPLVRSLRHRLRIGFVPLDHPTSERVDSPCSIRIGTSLSSNHTRLVHTGGVSHAAAEDDESRPPTDLHEDRGLLVGERRRDLDEVAAAAAGVEQRGLLPPALNGDLMERLVDLRTSQSTRPHSPLSSSFLLLPPPPHHPSSSFILCFISSPPISPPISKTPAHIEVSSNTL